MRKITTQDQHNPLIDKVEELSGQHIHTCYQCGTCSAGCPFASSMDLLPDQLMLHLRLELDDVLESKTIWMCTACATCAEHCPRYIDIAKIMEALRRIWLRQHNQDHINVGDLSRDLLENLPPIALVANFRKNTG